MESITFAMNSLDMDIYGHTNAWPENSSETEYLFNIKHILVLVGL